jgi:hypothetical protein
MSQNIVNWVGTLAIGGIIPDDLRLLAILQSDDL